METEQYVNQPEDGHKHQYLNGICTWCGLPTPEEPPEPTQPSPDYHELKAVVLTDGMKTQAPPDTVSETTISPASAEMLEAGRVFEVQGQKCTIQAFYIKPLEDAEIERFAGEAQKVLEWAKTLEITDHTSAKLVAGELRAISILRRGVDARAKDLTAPLAAVLKDMKTDLKTVTDPLAEADFIGRSKVTVWDYKQRKIIADAEDATRLAQESAEAAKRVTDAGGEAPDLSGIEIVDVPAAPTAIRPDGGGTVSMVDHWSAEVTAKYSIPGEYMEPNMQMLNLVARQRKGGKAIPGVKWVNKPTPRVV